MIIRCLIFASILLAAGSLRAQESPRPASWPVAALTAPTSALEIGAPDTDGLTRPVWYAGESYQGKPTRVFAWLGMPAAPVGKLPAMLLVHGGGGKAFQEWARHWASRGYVALAMDTAGQGPDGKRHADAGPDQNDASKFQPFTAGTARDMWSWHAVGAVLRGHGLLASLPEVDTSRVGITGISWGGYLTCLVAGLDPQLKVAVPVYGCGFLGANSYWRDRSLAALPAADRKLWLEWFDPSTTIGSTACPILFLNGTHDFAYPPDSYRQTYSLVKPELRTLAVRVDLPHGHIWTYGEVDAFVDHALRPEAAVPALVKLGDIRHDTATASVSILPGTQPVRAELHCTAGTGAWQSRQWSTSPAVIKDGIITGTLPQSGPVTFFFTSIDAAGLITSSSYAEVRTGPNTATIPRGKLENDFYEWEERQAAVMKLKSQENPDIVLIGDSITHLWAGLPNEPRGNRGAASWDYLFAGKKVINMGFGYDRTQNVLERLNRGSLDGLQPKAIVVHIGTNNLGGSGNARENTAEEIATAIEAIVLQCRARCPDARIILMAVMPRGTTPENPFRAKTKAVNDLLPAIAKSAGATLADVTPLLLDAAGIYPPEMSKDALHPAARGYECWAEVLKPLLP